MRTTVLPNTSTCVSVLVDSGSVSITADSTRWNGVSRGRRWATVYPSVIGAE